MSTVFRNHKKVFVDLVQKKGYLGTFQIHDESGEWSHVNVLSKCLDFHTEQCAARNSKIRPFILLNKVRFVNDGDYTECRFKIGYNELDGFVVNGMGYRTIKLQSHTIGVDGNQSLPDARMVMQIKKDSDKLAAGNPLMHDGSDVTDLAAIEHFHISTLVNLLEKKGYSGTFDLSAKEDKWQVFDKSRACLIYYLLQARRHHEFPSFSMRCFSYYKDDHDFIESTMRMNYDGRTGFGISSLIIHYPNLERRTLPLLRSMDLPNSNDLVVMEKVRNERPNLFMGPNGSTGLMITR